MIVTTRIMKKQLGASTIHLKYSIYLNINIVDNIIWIEQPIEEPKKRGRREIYWPPKETKQRGRPRSIKQPKDPKKCGRPRIERPPKGRQKKGRKPKPQKTAQVEWRPRAGRVTIVRGLMAGQKT